MKEKNISFVGLGKLGLPTLVHYASRGFKVIGFDGDIRLMSQLKSGIVTLSEPGVSTELQHNAHRIIFAESMEDAVSFSDVTFVVVPTPSIPSGAFSTDSIVSVADRLGLAIAAKPDRAHHLVVLVSTVLPGDTRRVFIPMLEATSGLSCGKDFGVCYSPEFVALGTVCWNLSNPDFMLIGESDAHSGEVLQKIYKKALGSKVNVRRMTLENAELVKIAINTFVTTKISYANMICALCEKVPGMDSKVVLEAIGLDRRIGGKYVGTGLGYGGPCFPRDNKALSTFAKSLGLDAPIAEATDEINSSQVQRLIQRIKLCADKDLEALRACVLGLSYKQRTAVVEQSQALDIAIELSRSGCKEVSVYDAPETMMAAKRAATAKLRYCDTLKRAVHGSDIVVIAVPDSAFIPPARLLKNNGSGVLLVDPWRQVDPRSYSDSMLYCPVGTPVSK